MTGVGTHFHDRCRLREKRTSGSVVFDGGAAAGNTSGFGATVNVAKPKKGSTVVVFGPGAVGLAFEMAEEDIHTKDGTVDIKGNPAIKTKTGNWKACAFILGNECCERLAYYGMSTNLVNYLVQRLNQSNVTASTTVTNWSGTCYVTPLIGAFLADSYLGRYWTIADYADLAIWTVGTC